ncbi:MAG: hypothetical protein JSR46_11215 [Verrucomicrobia bacterium]|nr:hypothetical protein [Verrucomicrobiota bacterium]
MALKKAYTNIPTKETGSLENQEEDEIPPSFLFLRLPLFQWKSFLIFTGVSLALILQWFFTSDIFNIPEDVAQSQHHFQKAKEGYLANRSYWDAKEQHFIDYIRYELDQSNDQELLERLEETPGEILVAYVTQRLPAGLQRLEHISIFLREGSPCSLIISKYETGIWPLKIMLSLELEVKIQARRLSLVPSRLRRGSQDLALGLSWAYFGPELDTIRQSCS